MFNTRDVRGDYARIASRGAEFTVPPTCVTGSTIAVLKDGCGNLVQLTELARGWRMPGAGLKTGGYVVRRHITRDRYAW